MAKRITDLTEEKERYACALHSLAGDRRVHGRVRSKAREALRGRIPSNLATVIHKLSEAEKEIETLKSQLCPHEPNQEAESSELLSATLEPSPTATSRATFKVAPTPEPNIAMAKPPLPSPAPSPKPDHFPPLPPNTRRIVEGDVPQDGDLVWKPGSGWEPRREPWESLYHYHTIRGCYARPLPEPLLTAEERVGEDLAQKDSDVPTPEPGYELLPKGDRHKCGLGERRWHPREPRWVDAVEGGGANDEAWYERPIPQNIHESAGERPDYYSEEDFQAMSNDEATPESDGTTEQDLESRIEALEAKVRTILSGSLQLGLRNNA
jgi:hypothetical protein